jgi:hypothetical protein
MVLLNELSSSSIDRIIFNRWDVGGGYFKTDLSFGLRSSVSFFSITSLSIFITSSTIGLLNNWALNQYKILAKTFVMLYSARVLIISSIDWLIVISDWMSSHLFAIIFS